MHPLPPARKSSSPPPHLYIHNMNDHFILPTVLGFVVLFSTLVFLTYRVDTGIFFCFIYFPILLRSPPSPIGVIAYCNGEAIQGESWLSPRQDYVGFMRGVLGFTSVHIRLNFSINLRKFSISPPYFLNQSEALVIIGGGVI